MGWNTFGHVSQLNSFPFFPQTIQTLSIVFCSEEKEFVNPDYFLNNCQTYLVLTLEAEPVSIRYFFHLWFEAIHVVSFVTTIAEKKLCFIFSTRTKLATLGKKQNYNMLLS